MSADADETRGNAAPPASTIRIMTYNIHAGKDSSGEPALEKQALHIKKEQPDVVGLQEVDHGTGRSGGVDQLELVAELTGLSNLAYQSSISYDGGFYGNAILSRFPLSDVRALAFPSVPSDPVRHIDGKLREWSSATERRGAITASITVGARRLTIACTHLSLFPEERDAAARLLDRTLPETAVLLGDMNTDDPSGILGSSWHNASDRVGSTHPLAGVALQIDHILYRGEVKPLRSWRSRSDASDHHAVVAEMKITPITPASES